MWRRHQVSNSTLHGGRSPWRRVTVISRDWSFSFIKIYIYNLKKPTEDKRACDIQLTCWLHVYIAGGSEFKHVKQKTPSQHRERIIVLLRVFLNPLVGREVLWPTLPRSPGCWMRRWWRTSPSRCPWSNPGKTSDLLSFSLFGDYKTKRSLSLLNKPRGHRGATTRKTNIIEK